MTNRKALPKIESSKNGQQFNSSKHNIESLFKDINFRNNYIKTKKEIFN